MYCRTLLERRGADWNIDGSALNNDYALDYNLKQENKQGNKTYAVMYSTKAFGGGNTHAMEGHVKLSQGSV